MRTKQKSSTGQKAYVQEVNSRQINTIETKQTTVIINHKNNQTVCRYELKPKFNSCELESLFHVKQPRKMNQEVIHALNQAHQSSWRVSSNISNERLKTIKII